MESSSLLAKRTLVNERARGLSTPANVIPLLQQAQERFGYISEQSLAEVAEQTGSPVSVVYGVATFYSQFRFQPPGEHLVRVCEGTACHVLGAERVMERFEEVLGIAAGETTGDGLFTLESVRCLGCCSLAPAVMLDQTTCGRVSDDAVPGILKRYRKGDSR